MRIPPPYECVSFTKQFKLEWPWQDGAIEQPPPLKVYLTVGLYENGKPCQIFFDGSTIGEFPHGVLRALAMAASLALQTGSPIEKIIKQWRGTRFPPEGFSGDEKFPRCTSLLDLCAQWMQELFT